MDVIIPPPPHTPRAAGAGEASVAVVDVPARPECVVVARRAVAGAAADAGLDVDRVDDLVVAVSEACTNAIEAQLVAGIADPVQVTCRVVGGSFVVSVVDAGPGFDPISVPVRPPLAEPAHLTLERGWGIQLMRSLVDRVTFEPSPEGTTVHLSVAHPGRGGTGSTRLT